MFHKRAPVRAVCGRVVNIAGEKLNHVELTLTGETGSVLFTTTSDTKGFFSFGSVAKGGYTLHAKAPGYHAAEREIRVTNTNVCDTGTHVKGVDNPSDLDSEFPKWR